VSVARAAADRFHRDRTTVVLFGPPVSYGVLLYSMSSATALMGADLGVSKAVAGLHGTLLAVGGLVAGLTVARLIGRFGRRRVLVGGLVGGALFTAALALGPSAAVTLPAAFASAVCAIGAMAVAYTAMVAHNGDKAPAALSEATSIAAAVGCLAPLAVAACAGLGWGWRPAIGLAAASAVAVAWAVRRVPHDESLDGAVSALGGAGRSPAPGGRRAFSAFVVANALSSMAEMGAVVWAGTLLTARTGASPGLAAGAVAALIGGLTLGRLAARNLVLRLGGPRLLAVGYAVSLAGLAALWTTGSLAVGIAGLAVTGFGFGPAYPMTMDLSLRRAPLPIDRAQSVLQVVNGATSAVAPFLLGWLADVWGVHWAYLVVPGAVVGAFAAVAIGGAAIRR
jgi:predicted MFS family arabinose efflux permease